MVRRVARDGRPEEATGSPQPGAPAPQPLNPSNASEPAALSVDASTTSRDVAEHAHNGTLHGPHEADDGTPRGAGTARLLSLGALTSGMLRDFNNVMCAVIGFAQLLHQELSPSSSAAGFARQILRAGSYGNRMSERLLEYAERQCEGPVTLDLRCVIDQACDLVRHLVGGHIRLVVEHPPSALSVRADPADLEYVVIALLLGARDAMPTGGHLQVHTRPVTDPETEDLPASGAWVHVSLNDTGIPPGPDAPGLLLVRQLVEQQGGVFRTEPRGDEGNAFDIFLPAA